MAMDVRHISPNGEIDIGDTQIRTLRKGYGVHFAEGWHDIHDQLLAKLEEICRQAA